MNEPRVYKNSPFVFGLLILIFAIIFFGLFANLARENFSIMIPFGVLFGSIFLIALFSITSKTIISDDEISTQNLLGTKTLRWAEINQISGNGYAIKLQDVDRSLTVAPSPQLPGYPEVVEWIGIKRPDLFNSQEYGEISKGLLAGLSVRILLGLIMIGFSIFAVTFGMYPFIVVPVVVLISIGIAFFAPQSVSIKGNSIVIGYLFKQTTLTANEIAAVNFLYTQTRNGKNYYVALHLVNGKSIRLSGLKPNLPVVYLILKDWHGNNTKSV